MVQPTKVPPTGETSNTQDVQNKKDPNARQINPTTDQGPPKRPFKEVFEVKSESNRVKKTASFTKTKSDDEEELLSPLDLAKTLAKPSKTPSVVDTIVFHKEEENPEPVVKQNTSIAEVDDSVDTTEPEVKAANAPVEKAKDPVKDLIDNVNPDTHTPVAIEKDKKQDDLAQSTQVINTTQPQVAQAAIPVDVPKPAQQATQVRQTLIQLASQMAEFVKQIKSPERTDTTLKLQYPPLFNGVEIKVTEFATSRSQFNVTFSFSELTQPLAKKLIEDKLNLKVLQESLLAQGYTLQTVTIEQKIPGLSSTTTDEAKLAKQNLPQEEKTGDATEQDMSSLA